LARVISRERSCVLIGAGALLTLSTCAMTTPSLACRPRHVIALNYDYDPRVIVMCRKPRLHRAAGYKYPGRATCIRATCIRCKRGSTCSQLHQNLIMFGLIGLQRLSLVSLLYDTCDTHKNWGDLCSGCIGEAAELTTVACKRLSRRNFIVKMSNLLILYVQLWPL